MRRAEKKLKRAQKDLSRKQNGSANRQKARVNVARAHARVADARRDFHHKLSTAIIRDNQVCSACGVKDGPKPLQVRAWTCTACGTLHDRDINAAKNIAALGRREAQNARGGDVRPPLAVAIACEPGSHRGAA